MQSFNKIFLMGYIGNDPKLFTTRNGKQFTALSVATNRNTMSGAEDEEGKPTKKTTTDWHSVRAWGKQAETCTKYLTKGAPVLIEGYVAQYVKQKDGGITERTTDIHATNVNFLPRAIRPADMNSTDNSTGNSATPAFAEH